MPQKRNPYALAVMRTAAGSAAGDLTAALVALHTGSARTDHFHLLNGSVPRALEEALATTRLAAAVAAGLTIDRARMAEAARRGFTAAADVADALAAGTGIDYRSAHTAVGRAVRALVEAGARPEELTSELLADSAEASIGRRVTLPPEALAEALDPAACVRARLQSGSTRPGEVLAMVADGRAQAAEARAWSAAAAGRAAEAERELLERARELKGSF
jgi:argininosuccinate lyase